VPARPRWLACKASVLYPNRLVLCFTLSFTNDPPLKQLWRRNEMEQAALSTHLTSLELRLPPLREDDGKEEDYAEPELHVRTATAALRRCGGLRELDITSVGNTPAATSLWDGLAPGGACSALASCSRCACALHSRAARDVGARPLNRVGQLCGAAPSAQPQDLRPQAAPFAKAATQTLSLTLLADTQRG